MRILPINRLRSLAAESFAGRPGLRSAAAILLLTLAAVTAPAIVRLDPTLGGPFERRELFAWTALVAAALAIPNLRLWRSGRFHVAHPFVHASWTYFLPFFVVGTAAYAGGGSTHIGLGRIPDAALHFRLALFYVALAVLALATGIGADVARRLGSAIARRLPAEHWGHLEVLGAGMALVVVGGAFTVAAFRAGVTGYQIEASPPPYSATLFYLSLTSQVGQFLVWFAVFSTGRRSWPFLAAAGALLVVLPFWVVLAGSRGLLFSNWLLVVLAFFLSGRKPGLANVAFLSLLGALSIAIGMLYGTTFRAIKGRETAAAASPGRPSAPPGPASPSHSLDNMNRELQRRVTVGEQFALAGTAVETIRSGPSGFRPMGVLFARLDAVSSLAVLVANREALRDRAPATLRRGILIGLASSVVPRVLWPGKPVIGDVRAYGSLYFGLSSNSFAVTPFGDLLLNFGPAALPAGMALLGLLMRLLYAALAESGPPMAGRSAVYALCLLTISFEGFYATIVPGLLRVLVVSLAAVGVALLVTGLAARRRAVPRLAPPSPAV